MVPISVSTRASPNKAVHRSVIEDKETTITVENVAEGDWLKVTLTHYLIEHPVVPTLI